MKINFYNYYLIGKRMKYIFPLMMDFIEEQETTEHEEIQKLLKEKFPYGAEHGMTSIDTRTIALLNLSKEELLSTITHDGFSYIYYKDFKKTIQRINEYNKLHYNTNLAQLLIFFKCSYKAKSESIAFCLQSKEP